MTPVVGVVLDVDRGAGPVVLARRVDDVGIPKDATVLGEGPHVERVGAPRPALEGPPEEIVRIAADQPLR